MCIRDRAKHVLYVSLDSNADIFLLACLQCVNFPCSIISSKYFCLRFDVSSSQFKRIGFSFFPCKFVNWDSRVGSLIIFLKNYLISITAPLVSGSPDSVAIETSDARYHSVISLS